MIFGSKKELNLTVEGMTCGHCEQAVEDALSGVPGVKKAQVDLEAGRARVKAKEDVDEQRLVEAVVEAGYEARLERS